MEINRTTLDGVDRKRERENDGGERGTGGDIKKNAPTTASTTALMTTSPAIKADFTIAAALAVRKKLRPVLEAYTLQMEGRMEECCSE